MTTATPEVQEEKTLNMEIEDCPKMLQVYSEHAYHEVFCYALAYEKLPNKREYDVDKLLMTLISGSDSAIQSIKAAIDMGSQGLRFGYGTKGLTSYEFTGELSLGAEKGKYDKIPMPINRNRKAIALIHEDITSTAKYVLSFEGNPAHEIANLLGGAQYGLHILKEWEETVFDELIRLGYLVKHEIYKDNNLFPLLEMYSIDLTEEQADQFISDLIKSGRIKFPVAGDGSGVAAIDDLPKYLMDHSNDMVQKVTSLAIPTHDPLQDKPLEHFNSYKRELFPVQSHVATAIAKRLTTQKSIILQGEMSVGKSVIMAAVADGYAHLKKMKGYFSVLICPPSLTAK
ncbi:hypothetical protein LG296_20745 (plasmid) [Ureibacillus chungkukjangi]|uniref:hypothetical protein n=1 Tax=Ureibacillus chungkukjangi TaxID=1202712 RepID=UPI002006FFB1|nr:hypothetical protein [Ureibacillus chungkukjangi]